MRQSTLGNPYSKAPIPRLHTGESYEQMFPMQAYLDEKLPKDGMPWWAQDGSPEFADMQGNQIFEDWSKANPWRRK
jgi:hypothetical protein